MVLRILFLLCCCCFADMLFAQTDSATLWFNKAESFTYNNKYREATFWFEKAADQYLKTGVLSKRVKAKEAILGCYECLGDYDNAYKVALLIQKENPTNKKSDTHLIGCSKTINGSRLLFKEKMNKLPLYANAYQYSLASIRAEYEMLKKNQIANLDQAFMSYQNLKDFNQMFYYLVSFDFYVPECVLKVKKPAIKADSIAAEKLYAKALSVGDSATWYLWKSVQLFVKNDSWDVARINKFAQGWKGDKKMKDHLAYAQLRQQLKRGDYNEALNTVGGYREKEIILAKAEAFNRGEFIRYDKRDSVQANVWYDRATHYAATKTYDSAILYYNKASREYFFLNNWRKYINCLIGSGRSLESATWKEKTDRELHGMSLPYEYFEFALLVCQTIYPTSEMEAKIRYALGDYYKNTDDMDEAMRNYEEALNLYSKNPSLHADEGKIIFSMGNYYEYENDYEKSILYYNRALAIAQQQNDTNLVANCYQGIAHNLYYSGNYDGALASLEEAISVDERGNDQAKRNASVNIVRGNIYAALKRADQSVSYYKKAMSYYQTQKDTSNLLLIYYNTITILVDSGREKEASDLYNKAVKLLDLSVIAQSSDTDLKERAIRFLNFVSSNQKAKKSSLEFSTRAILLNFYRTVDMDDYTTGKWFDPALATEESNGDAYFSGEMLLESYQLRAALLMDIFKQKKEVQSLDRAMNTYAKADSLISRMRNKATTESAQLRISGEVQQMNEEAIRAAIDGWNFTKNEKYKAKAFYFIERSKAGALRNALAEVNAKANVGIPDSLLQRERAIKTKINILAIQLEQSNLEKNEIVTNQLFDLNRELAAIINTYESVFPEYYKLKHEENVISADEIRKELRADQASVEYFLGYNNLYACIITKDKFEIIDIPLDTTLTHNINAMRKSLIFQLDDEYVKYSNRVNKQIFEPVKKRLGAAIKRLLIIPDGILSYVPFEALVTDATFSTYQKLHYLIRDYEISYALSATLFHSNVDKPVSKEKSCIAFAPVFTDINNTNFLVKSCDRFYEGANFEGSDKRAFSRDGRYISPLPATESEVLRITKLVADKNLFAKYFLFSDAREEIIKSEELSHYQYIHFATHGMINDTNPALSGLLLSQDSTSTEDGILYAGEVYGLKLNADLVTLSACETGLGKIVEGEGVIGLTRGWLYAGARNVIVSLWKVADESTSELMIDFYNEFLEGANKPSALRNAKLKMLNQEMYANPFYWSPFVLIEN